MVKRWALSLRRGFEVAVFFPCNPSLSRNPVNVNLISEDAPRATEQECFTPLAARVGLALLDGMGINSSRVVDCSLHTDSGSIAKLVVAFHVLPDDLARVLQALAAIPLDSER
jgi:hypothetical protein